MNRKSHGWSTSKTLMLLAAVLIAVLAVFAVYEYMRADALSSSVSQAQSQQNGISSQLNDLQQQMDSLQSQNAALQSQNAALQSQMATPTPPPYVSADPNKKVAYLTFDDGPNEVYTPGVLNVLNQLGIKATFFVSFQGSDSAEKRALLKQEADDGHTIGVHTWSHSYPVCYADEQAFLDDFNHMESVIKEVTGITPKINRFPGGSDNTVSMTASHSILMPTLKKDMDTLGYKTFDWNAGGEDANESAPNHPTNAAAFVKVILSDAGDTKNLVVLIHDKFDYSAATVTSLVKELKKRGYTFDVLTPNSPDCIHPFAKPRAGLQEAGAMQGGEKKLE